MSAGGVAVDGAHNVYFVDTGNNAIEEWSPATGMVTTLVSSGLNNPFGVAVDGAGNVYIADSGNSAIKKWSPATGTVSTLVSARLNEPLGLAVDGAGNVYFADGAIEKWSPATGTVTTLVSAGLNSPFGVAVDGAGNVYIADTYNYAIKEWSPASGTITTLVSAGLYRPVGVAVDGAGSVYIADSDGNAIKELPRAFVDPTAKLEPAADGSDVLVVLPATEHLAGPLAASSDQPWLTITGVTNGVVSFAFTADLSVSRSAHIALLGTNATITQAGAITASLGTNTLTEAWTAGTDSVALIVSSPVGPWAATANAPWLHLSSANQTGAGSATVVFTFDANPGAPRTGTLTIAGQTLTVRQFGPLTSNALGTTTLLEGPRGGVASVVLAYWASFDAWTASANAAWLHLSAANQGGIGSTNLVFSLDANPGATRTGTLTVAGLTLTVTQAGATYVAANPLTTLVSSRLNNPFGVAVDGPGNVYIADTNNSLIKEWSPTAGTVTTLVSSGLFEPEGVAVDAAGNVFIADCGNNAVKEWSPATGKVTTLVSSGLRYPSGVAVDAAGNVYIADYYNNAIRKWSPATGTVTTLVSAGLWYPWGVAVDGAGNVFIADSNDNAIKMWSPATGTVTTVVGNLYRPVGVAVDGVGNIYMTAPFNNAIEELPRAAVDPTAKLEAAAAGTDALPVVLPATENLAGPFAPTSDSAWLTITGVTNGVVSFAFTANATHATRTAHLTVLGQSIAITQAGAAAPTLANLTWLPGGNLQFSFTGTPGASYSVLLSTNAALPMSAWTVVGPATESPAGQFQFTVTPSAATPSGFYRVRSP